MDPRDDPSAAGFGKSAAEVKETTDKLEQNQQIAEVRRERFSWLSRRVLLESRNDQFAKYIHDVVQDERPRWIAAQRAAGVERHWPDFVIDRADLASFRCLLVGDPGEGDRSQWVVAEAMTGDPSDFMVVLSDVVYAAGDVNQYVEKFYAPYAAYKQPVYGLPGNHDWYDGLEGFMFHFCGAEQLPRSTHRAGSFPVREALARVMWRRSSRPDRRRLLGLRQTPPPQPGPYWCLQTRHLAFVAIDTGISGKLDHQQGQWLVRISEKIDKPKVLLTGKPLYVDNEPAPCEIQWAEGTNAKYETVDDVVRAFDYVATIGGDVHNYQRYPIKSSDRTVHHIVAGGAGAYTGETHSIGRADKMKGPDEEELGLTENETRLFPLRGDSLALLSQEFIRQTPKYAGIAVATALALALLGVLLWTADGWSLWRAGALIAGVGVLQLAYGLLGPRERQKRIGVYVLVLVALGAALAVFDRNRDEGASPDVITVVLALAPVALPAIVIAVGGWQVRRFAGLVSLLALVALASWLIEYSAVELGARIAAVTVLAAMLLALVGFGLARQRRGRPALQWPNDRIVAIAVGTVAAICAAVLVTEFADVLAVLLWVVAVAALIYLILLGVFATAFEWRGKPIEDDKALTNHAAKFVAGRLDLNPVRPGAEALEAVDPRYAKLFKRLYESGGLRKPFHKFQAEMLDFDEPPLAKSFLALEVTEPTPGEPELLILAKGVSGVPLGASTIVDETPPIPLARAAR